jgi:hypothetical protein
MGGDRPNGGINQ